GRKRRQAAALQSVRRDLRCDASTHRLATNHQAIPFQLLMVVCRGYDGAIAGFEFRSRIGNTAALLHVLKVESNYVNATLGQSRRKQSHERMQLICARAVAEDHGYAGTILFGSEVQHRADAFAVAETYFDLLWLG